MRLLALGLAIAVIVAGRESKSTLSRATKHTEADQTQLVERLETPHREADERDASRPWALDAYVLDDELVPQHAFELDRVSWWAGLDVQHACAIRPEVKGSAASLD